MKNSICDKAGLVIPAQAGIQDFYSLDFNADQINELDSRRRGNDDFFCPLVIFHKL